MPLVYPLLYLLGRMAWIGWKGRGTSGRPLWPVWLLLAATVFLAGFRFELNLRASNVIDVGLAGVIGAQRIVEDGQAPYGNMPEDEGEVRRARRRRVRARADPDERPLRGGERPRGHLRPLQLPRLRPGFVTMGYDYEWDYLPGHFTSLLWDTLALVGMGVLGFASAGCGSGRLLRSPGPPTPSRSTSRARTRTTRSCRPCSSGGSSSSPHPARGLFRPRGVDEVRRPPPVALWASYPRAWKWPRQQLLFLGGFLLATALAFWVLLLEPDPVHAARVFWDRTIPLQLSRPSPFSIWDWDEYPGYTDARCSRPS